MFIPLMAEHIHTVERLVKIFGSVDAVGRYGEVKQNTVSGWRNKTVPLRNAVKISRNAERDGIDLTLRQLLDWIAADLAQAETVQ